MTWASRPIFVAGGLLTLLGLIMIPLAGDLGLTRDGIVEGDDRVRAF